MAICCSSKRALDGSHRLLLRNSKHPVAGQILGRIILPSFFGVGDEGPLYTSVSPPSSSAALSSVEPNTERLYTACAQLGRRAQGTGNGRNQSPGNMHEHGCAENLTASATQAVAQRGQCDHARGRLPAPGSGREVAVAPAAPLQSARTCGHGGEGTA